MSLTRPVPKAAMPVVKVLRRTIGRKRFEGFVSKQPSGCWLWNRGKTGSGYGVLYIRISQEKVAIGAHRAAYMLYRGALAHNVFVCHHCDEPSCVNPEHLFVATHAGNMRDAINKGRVIPPHGLKLNGALAATIRDRYRKGGCTTRSLAKDFGVGKSLIHCIVTGRTWPM